MRSSRSSGDNGLLSPIRRTSSNRAVGSRLFLFLLILRLHMRRLRRRRRRKRLRIPLRDIHILTIIIALPQTNQLPHK